MIASKSENKITVTEAAEKLGMRVQTLRLALQQGRFKEFGEAVLTTPAEKSKIGKDRYTYYINPERFNMYLEGIKTW